MADTAIIRKPRRRGYTLHRQPDDRAAVDLQDPNFLALTFDATVEEQHDLDANITAHDVEEGAEVSDHIQLLQGELKMVVHFSNSPTFGAPIKNRDIVLYEQLEQLHAERGLLTVVTSLKVYRNMAIKSVSTPRTVSQGQKAVCTIIFRPVRITRRQTRLVPPQRTRKKSSETTDDKDKQNGKDGKGNEKKRGNSIALQGLDALGLTEKFGLTKPGL